VTGAKERTSRKLRKWHCPTGKSSHSQAAQCF